MTVRWLSLAMSAAITAGGAIPPPDDLTSRWMMTLSRVLDGGPPVYDVAFVLADALPRHERRFTEFSGDVSGRFIEALVVVERHLGQKFPILDEVVARLPAAQKPEGFFGDAFPEGPIRPQPHMALLWGNGRLLIGLAEYARLRGDAAALACARRLADFIVAVAPRLNNDVVMEEFSGDQHAVGYICWTQIIEGLAALHEATREPRYLDVAREMARRVRLHEGQHSHGLLTSARGMVRLAAVTGETEWLARATSLWHRVLATGNLLAPHGCIPEAFRPMVMRDEGCSEADWVRLSLALWQATGEPAYLDAAEHTLFNEFSMNQFSTGDFGHRTISPDGMGGAVLRAPKGGATNVAFSAVSIAHGSARAWWCCTLHGLRTFPDVAAAVFRSEGGALYYDLPFSGEAVASGLVVRARSTLQRDATCRLEVVESDGREHLLGIRVPPWAEDLEISLSPPGAAEGAGAWRTLHRVWRAGDTITIRYRLRTRAVPHPERKDVVAFMVGPWVLGVEPSGSPSWFDEPRHRNRILVEGLPNAPVLPSAPDEAVRRSPRLAAPVAYRGLPFRPGGYPVQPQLAWLRPIAEQTGLRDDTEWVYWFTFEPR
ncbi:MAG: glycoside hydrolase family 127 protein [Kiritimatiellae bacterium]|nr:glycoside hydrolase family 127 protein [Kiritimatiellia bacterium]